MWFAGASGEFPSAEGEVVAVVITRPKRLPTTRTRWTPIWRHFRMLSISLTRIATRRALSCRRNISARSRPRCRRYWSGPERKRASRPRTTSRRRCSTTGLSTIRGGQLQGRRLRQDHLPASPVALTVRQVRRLGAPAISTGSRCHHAWHLAAGCNPKSGGRL